MVHGEFLRDGMHASSLARLLGHCLSSILRGFAAPLRIAPVDDGFRFRTFCDM